MNLVRGGDGGYSGGGSDKQGKVKKVAVILCSPCLQSLKVCCCKATLNLLVPCHLFCGWFIVGRTECINTLYLPSCLTPEWQTGWQFA